MTLNLPGKLLGPRVQNPHKFILVGHPQKVPGIIPLQAGCRLRHRHCQITIRLFQIPNLHRQIRGTRTDYIVARMVEL